MGSIILELSFLLYKVVSLNNIQETIQTTIYEYNIKNYYLDFEIENCSRTQQKGVYTIHFEDNVLTTKDILSFLRKINKIPNVNLECIYKDNIKCDIIYASKYYLKQMDKLDSNEYNNKKKTRAYSETEFEILKGIHNIFNKKNKKYFVSEPPKTYDEYLKMCK